MMRNSRSWPISVVVAGATLAAAISGWADGTQATENLWSVGEDKNGCFAASVQPAIGITFSFKDDMRIFLVDGGGSVTVPEATAHVEIGSFGTDLGLKPLDDDGNWFLEEKNGLPIIRRLVFDIMQGTSGPLKIRSDDAGFSMDVDTTGLKERGRDFLACVSRALPRF